MTTKRRSLSAANDEAALLWAGPFGYAVLQVLRRGDDFAEADFAEAMRKAPAGPASRAAAQVEKLARAEAVRTEYQVTMSEDNPAGSPDFVGDYVSRAGPTPVTEPAPPAGFYKRVTPR